jgi:predicted nucleic acid-binding protein
VKIAIPRACSERRRFRQQSLNYLAAPSDFDLLRQIYGTLLIPPAVYREVAERGAAYPVQSAVLSALGQWISLADAPDAASVQRLKMECRLDLGESEAIVVAESLGNDCLLMDEQRGVRGARSWGMIVIRTPLIYTDAKILGLIGSVRERLDALRTSPFRRH